MHFAKTYAEAAKDLPEEWLPYLISYKALKKCIAKIVEELAGRGLSVELLEELQGARSAAPDQPPLPAPPAPPPPRPPPPPSPPAPRLPDAATASAGREKPAEGYQQVLLDTGRQRLLYTFSDSSHPCLVVIVNEQLDAWSADPTPVSTPPASPALSACARFACAEASEDGGACARERRDSSSGGVPLAQILSERLSELDLAEAADARSGFSGAAGGAALDGPTGGGEPDEGRQQDCSDDDDCRCRDDEEDGARERNDADRRFASRDGFISPDLPLPAVGATPPPPVDLQRQPAGYEPVAKRPKFEFCADCPGKTPAPPVSPSPAEAAPPPPHARAGYRPARSRRQSRKAYTTIYADDGQAVRIARCRRSDRGRWSAGEPGAQQCATPTPGEPVAAAAAENAGASGEPPPSLLPGSSGGCRADAGSSAHAASPAAAGSTKSIKVTLLTDVDFFNTILTAIARLGEFQDDIKTAYDQRIWRIAGLVAAAATPAPQQGWRRGSPFGFGGGGAGGRAECSDMYAWREIMATFAEEEIWFDGSGVVVRCDTAAKLEKCRSRFGRWERLASERCLPKFKLQKSKVAFADFLKLNRELLAVKQFRELNKMAIAKILKKHDKRTRLICRAGFENLIAQNLFVHDSLTHSLCCAVATRLMTIVPQPRDYSCPVCMSISWKPIRLACGHVFCVRCLIKAQRRKMTNCPLCRSAGSVARATAENLDVPLMNLLRLYFPAEVKEKRRENAKELLETDGFY